MNVRIDPSGPLRGAITAPGDKSISHRVAMLGAMADEPVRITGFLDAEDTNATLRAVEALGALVERRADEIVIRGTGLRQAREPEGVIDVGNAGTLMRLLPGWLAGQAGRSFTLDGDASIRRRPIDRIAEPLRLMGAQLEATDGRLPPFTVAGRSLTGITYELPVASAQVKSCVLLAGMLADGETTVVEPQASRDHTERLLALAGAPIRREGNAVTVLNVDELSLPDTLHVPSDPSSAAFLVAAGVLVKGSRLVIEDCAVNWTRTGFFEIARRMGAIVLGDLERPVGDAIPPHEPLTDLDVTAGPLVGTTVGAAEVPLAIDTGAQELRLKESDRIAAVVEGLNGLGGDLEATADGFVVRGTGGLRGGTIDARGDHRTAMLGAVAGLASQDGVEVLGMDAAAVSYPGFLQDLERLR